jgi:hypothetical protein
VSVVRCGYAREGGRPLHMLGDAALQAVAGDPRESSQRRRLARSILVSRMLQRRPGS